ncbi:MAG: NAD(P)-binding domain-containing protein [Gemmatimonadales bacterium]|nr:NAD(P)-binding domain-containing protein [Gemmatimonadales bacterium]
MSADNLIIGGVAAALMLIVMLPFYLSQRRREKRTDEAEATAHRYGLHEPVSLHPVVSAEACIGTGNCLTVCPEHDVIGFRDGQAITVTPARCVGHGLCERACPVEAIQLVFGSEKRGVEIPRIRENFESNVPGLFIVGELGGMGLIRNAFEQGRQCIEGIAKLSRARTGMLDVLIIGCGPAGLSASVNCLHHKLRFETLEKEDIGGTVRYYPRKKIVMTAPVRVPGYGKLGFHELPKEELIGVWEDIVARTGLEVRTEETVNAVRHAAGYFEVTSSKGTYTAKQVVLAIGRRGVPRKLGVNGETLPKVIYSLREPEVFQQDRILVVGGGDSAVEAALALSEQQGNRVTISYRRDKFARLKPRNLELAERAIAAGQVDVLWQSNVLEIRPHSVIYRDQLEREQELANDVVAIFAGGEMPTAFLKACGVEFDTKFGTP